MARILAVDGNSILNRAFYGVKPLTNKDGLQTGAVFGMLNIILSQADKYSPDGVVVAFDLKAPTFRHKMYDKYKSNRHKMPDELRVQLPWAKEVIAAMGWKVVTKEGYEADDILGTVSAITEKAGGETYLLSGDRDLYQLIDGSTKLLLAGNSETKLCGIPEFKEKYEITPDLFVDLKAMMGDPSDCIPGIPGIGEKTAIKLMLQYGSLDGLYEGDLSGLGKSTREKIIAGKESAYLSKNLAKIFTDVPLAMGIDELLSSERNDAELYRIFTELEFGMFIKRFGLAEKVESSPKKDYKEIELTSLSELHRAEPLAIELSENELIISGKDSGFTLKYSDISELSDFFAEHKIIVYDSKELYKRLWKKNIEDINVLFDVKLAGYTLDPSISDYSPARLSVAYLGHEFKNGDAYSLFELYNILSEKIEGNGLSYIYSLELSLAAVLADMELHGFKIEKEKLIEYSRELALRLSEYEKRIYELAGGEFNINSPKQLGEVLFERLGLPTKKKTKSGYSTSADILEKLIPYHEIIPKILEYRKLAKLKSTYADGLYKVADGEGIIRTEFKQTGTATGRLSSAEPNLQNIPIRTEEGRRLRKFFVPRAEGRVLIDADYSQIELRILGALSGDPVMISAFQNGDDIHTITASEIFSVAPEFVTPDMRKKAKTVNFGIVYGISDYTLGEDLGIPKYQASEYIAGYFRTYPKIKKYLEEQVKFATEHGYSKTMFGRIRYIPELSAGKAMLRMFGERVAMNAPVQGTAADVIKIAMVNTHKALKEANIDAKLILQVHDELIIDSSEADSQKAAEILKREMESAVSLSVPLPVELSMGKTWYECK